MTTELHSSLAAAGMHVAAGDLGENITCKGLQVLDLPLHTKLRVGSTAVLTVTGA
jgi:MOSC domain-containing protein YiiM